MKMSRMLIPTLREIPADAEITSHKLMLRAGMIRKTTSGVYNFLPFGLSVLKKVENIIREELEKKGCQELLCSALIPSELWKESGRWDVMGKEMFRFNDRNERDFCLGPTHEEVFTDIIRQEITSYKQLPLNLYQIQAKYRDEVRPRFGVMRSKEFIMKDAYSFDIDESGLDKSYDDMKDAYINIFKRLSLDCSPVEADSGAIGGSSSAEFMVKSEVGEDEVAFCTCCDYAANIEKATAKDDVVEAENLLDLNLVETPNAKTIDELAKFFDVTPKKLAKTLLYEADGKVVAVVVRGDRSVNEVKVINAIGGVVDFELASEEVVKTATSAQVGFAGPIGIKADIILIDTEVSKQNNMIVGANKTDYHIENANFERDFNGTVGDFKNINTKDKCIKCNGDIQIARGVEVGHIFKLGTKYSKSMSAKYIDKDGREKDIVMGCYGIGVNRTIAAIIEQHNDENGIIWPLEVAPYHAIVIPVNVKNEEQSKNAEKIYNELKSRGIEVLLDDRQERVGVKFKDAELIGIPFRITIGKDIDQRKVEFKLRNCEDKELINIDEINDKIISILRNNTIKLK